MLARGEVEEFHEVLNDMKKEAEQKNRDHDYYQPAANRRKGNDGAYCMTIVPVFRAMSAQAKPLPVTIDANLTHIKMDFGKPSDDNLISSIDALVDTGAGCTIGNLDHFAREVVANPSILEEVFTCKDG